MSEILIFSFIFGLCVRARLRQSPPAINYRCKSVTIIPAPFVYKFTQFDGYSLELAEIMKFALYIVLSRAESSSHHVSTESPRMDMILRRSVADDDKIIQR